MLRVNYDIFPPKNIVQQSLKSHGQSWNACHAMSFGCYESMSERVTNLTEVVLAAPIKESSTYSFTVGRHVSKPLSSSLPFFFF